MAKRTDSEMKTASGHLFYEFTMLRETARWLGANSSGNKSDNVAWNVYLESFLVHARNLIVCLGWREGSHRDDVHAKDFVPGWKAKPETESWVNDVYEEACGRIVHLSYARLIQRDDWPIRSIAEVLQEEVLRFNRLVPDHLRDERWDKSIDPVFPSHSSYWVAGVTTHVGIIRLFR